PPSYSLVQGESLNSHLGDQHGRLELLQGCGRSLVASSQSSDAPPASRNVAADSEETQGVAGRIATLSPFTLSVGSVNAATYRYLATITSEQGWLLGGSKPCAQNLAAIERQVASLRAYRHLLLRYLAAYNDYSATAWR